MGIQEPEGEYVPVTYYPQGKESGTVARKLNHVAATKCTGTHTWRRRRWPYRAGWHHICITCGAFAR